MKLSIFIIMETLGFYENLNYVQANVEKLLLLLKLYGGENSIASWKIKLNW